MSKFVEVQEIICLALFFLFGSVFAGVFCLLNVCSQHFDMKLAIYVKNKTTHKKKGNIEEKV